MTITQHLWSSLLRSEIRKIIPLHLRLCPPAYFLAAAILMLLLGARSTAFAQSVAGNLSAVSGNLNTADRILLNTNTIYQTNYRSDTVEVFSLRGFDLGVFARLAKPTGLVFDDAGNLYVSSDDRPRYSILKFAPDGSGNGFGNNNTAMGNGALFFNTNGNSNTCLGFNALNNTTGSNNIDIGNKGKAGESQYIRIGTKGTHTHTLIAGISGVTVAGGVGVIIDTNGKLGTIVSSARYKDAIKPMDRASEAILALKPVTFRYKKDLDPDAIPQFGLVAEEVEKVNPALVARDEQGKAYTVRYEAVNAMLLNEFLKEHRKVQELGRKSDAQAATIIEMKSSAAKQDAIEGRLESMLKQQQEEIAALTSQLRSVKTGLEADKASSPLVAHNP